MSDFSRLFVSTTWGPKLIEPMLNLGIVGGFTAGPLICLAGVSNMILSIAPPLREIAFAAVLVGAIWPLLAIVVAHLRRPARPSATPISEHSIDNAAAQLAAKIGAERQQDVQHVREDFGAALRRLRMSYYARVRPALHASQTGLSSPPARNTELSVSTFIEWLLGIGYSIPVEIYLQVEAGKHLPPDAKEFLTAVSTCLRASTNDHARLVRLMAWKILVDSLGQELAQQCLGEEGGLGRIDKQFRR